MLLPRCPWGSLFSSRCARGRILLRSVLRCLDRPLLSGTGEQSAGPDGAWLVVLELLLSGVSEPRDGPSPCWLMVLSPARSELVLEAVRGGRKVSRMELQPRGGTGCHLCWAMGFEQGRSEQPLPGLAWPQPSSTRPFASYRCPLQHRRCTPSWLRCDSSWNSAGECLVQHRSCRGAAARAWGNKRVVAVRTQ